MLKQTVFVVGFLLSMAVNAAETQNSLAWKEDILTLQKQVKTKHIEPFHSISEKQFDSNIDKLLARLDELNEAQVEVAIMGLLASINDGHSNYNLMSGPHRHFPFNFKFFGDSLRVIATNSSYSKFAGSELIAINGISIAELIEKLEPYLSGVDNQYSLKVRFAFQITIAKFLYGSGITKHAQQANFTFLKQGKIITKTIKSIPMQAFAQLNSPYLTEEPMLNISEIKMPGIQLLFLAEYQSAYFNFDRYPPFETVLNQCESLKNKLKRSNAKRLIIDFRGNGGGNFYTGLAFSSCLLPLDQIDWLNGVIVLIDSGTFSAAMSNAVQFKQILNAKLIGSPTGGDPNLYSESHRLMLPNSGRRFSLSKRYYPFSEQPTDALYPDVWIDHNWTDYQQGKDNVLIKVLEGFK